ncbi:MULTISPECIES: hypothetical protein [unclassified Nocardioides]|uniref:hypothetical protein n=1 Tax=unclassified Nocardioides TaxID=2615069 RepID=UPI0010554855|nr:MULTISPECIES: hypothetical protein [unclassified Nocardioides]
MANADLTNANLDALDADELLSRAGKLMGTGRALGILDDADETLYARMTAALVDHALKHSRPNGAENPDDGPQTAADRLGEALGEMRKRAVDDGDGLPDGDSEPPAHKRDPSSSFINASGNAGGVAFDRPVWTTAHGAPFPKTVEAIARRIDDERLAYLLTQYQIANLNTWLQWERVGIILATVDAWRRWLTTAGHAEVLDRFNEEAPDYRTCI